MRLTAHQAQRRLGNRVCNGTTLPKPLIQLNPDYSPGLVILKIYLHFYLRYRYWPGYPPIVEIAFGI